MKKKIVWSFFFILFCYFIFNGFKIYNYSFTYSEQKSDVGIVLGAGTTDGQISPIFRERLNHAVYLYKKGIIKKLILTGGYGENQTLCDSEIAKAYVLKQGIPKRDVLTESQSKYTIENLTEAKFIMDSFHFKTALLISDPLHMKRSISLAKKLGLNCESSPTQTSMYKSFYPKLKSLIYETFYYTLGKLTGNN